MRVLAAILIGIALILLFRKEPSFPQIRLTRNGAHGYFYRMDDINKFGLIADDHVGFPQDTVFTEDSDSVQVLGQGTPEKPIIVDTYSNAQP